MRWVLFAFAVWLAGCSEAPPPSKNRLAGSPSRYLQAHADNPVDWYPWGEAAFARAKREDKPVFVSIGYLACHWCHVMEEESFRDPAVAAVLNRDFVSVKVDREERPDLDHRFMTYLVGLKGSGGWPLSVFLTPEGEPFYAGTYFPPKEAHGLPAFTTVLARVDELWKKDRGKLTAEARRAMAELEARSQVRFEGKGGAAAQRRTAEGLRSLLTSAPEGAQFPQLENLRFLLRYGHRTGEKWVLPLVLAQVEKMLAGGLKDHVGGGFHRYCVDREWKVPHFEKMLVDQADWAQLFLDLYQLTGDDRWKRECRQVLDFVAREMSSPAGFVTSLDADSGDPPREGAYYVWPDSAGVTLAEGGVVQGGLSEDDRSRLFQERERRPRPQRDELVVTARNARMVAAFARAGALFDERRYLGAAAQSAQPTAPSQKSLAGDPQDLQHSPGVPAFALDYAEAIAAELALYEAHPHAERLERARALQKVLDDRFTDPRGGYFEALDVPRSHQEHATDALTAENRWRLGLPPRSVAVDGNVPLAFSAELALAPERRVVVTGGATALWKAALRPYCPPRRLLLAEEAPELATEKGAAAYVCEGTRCSLPLRTTGEVEKALR